MNKQRHGVIIVFIVGFFLLFEIIGYFSLSSEIKDIRACPESAEGVVVENRRYSSKGNRGYTPVVEFHIGNSQIIAASKTTIVTNKINPEPTFQIGERVSLRYDPQNPSNIRIEGYDKKYGVFDGMIMMAVGIVIPFLAYWFLLRRASH